MNGECNIAIDEHYDTITVLQGAEKHMQLSLSTSVTHSLVKLTISS